MPSSFNRIAFVASDSPNAQRALQHLVARYGDVGAESADVIVALGGDGLILQTLHRFMDSGIPIYGMHRGSIGFMMNEFREEGLCERLNAAVETIIHPLRMEATDIHGEARTARAVNEVSLFRQTHQVAKIRILVDGKVRLDELAADGVLVATPAGSTAYNLSAHGPILPLNAPLLALTPMAAFRPRRWRGALLPDRASVTLEVLEPERRPVAAVADHDELRDVTRVNICLEHECRMVMLHDPDQQLEERIIAEQFSY